MLPYLGVLIYVIARGKSMGKRDLKEVQEKAAFKAYVREAAGAGDTGGGAPKSRGSVEELAKLADLKDRGAITEEEFRQAKTKLLI